MSAHCFTLLAIVLLAGCSSEIGDHYRDIAEYNMVKSRFPSTAVQHFPETAPQNAKMYGYFVPLQGGDGLQLSVVYDQAEFDTLLAEAESNDYDSSIGVDFNNPDTLLNGEMSPHISLGDGEPEIPNPKDRIFRIQNGPPIDCGLIFRTNKRIVVYWVYLDE